MEIFCSVWCRQNKVECLIRNESIRDQRWLSSRNLQLKIDIFQSLVVSVYWLSIWSRLMWEKKVFFWVEGSPFHLSYRIDAPIFRTYPCVNLIKDVSRRWRTNIREITKARAHVSQRIPLSRKTPFSCARRWDGKRELWNNFFSTLRKCEKRCRIKELAWFDIRRQSQRVEMYQQKIRRN